MDLKDILLFNVPSGKVKVVNMGMFKVNRPIFHSTVFRPLVFISFSVGKWMETLSHAINVPLLLLVENIIIIVSIYQMSQYHAELSNEKQTCV